MTTDDFIGKRVGGYEILEKIGQGGMATVYRAQQISMNRTTAIKILPRQFLSDDSYMQRFNREVKIVSQLEHRNIVPVYDYGEYEGLPYIIMRYMPSGSVDDLLRRDGKLTPEKMLSIIDQIAPALDYAHSKGVLHRDLKPSNVLLDDDDGAYLTDFGIARILTETGPGITTQGVVGTPSYMSPEQAQGHELDGRSDIYSLGIMLFEMATGRRPFQSDTPYSIAVMQVTTPPPAPRVLNPQISIPVENVIYRALEKKADKRYPNGEALVEALRAAVNGTSGTFKTHDTQPSGMQNPIKRSEASPPAAQPPVNQQVASSPPPFTPYTQQPAQTGFQPTPTSSSAIAYRREKKKRRGSGFFTNMMIGGMIGCGLLGLLAVIGVIIFGVLAANNNNSTIDAGGDAEIVQTRSGDLATLDATSQAARETLLASGLDVSITPEASASETIVPVGVRPTFTIDPALGIGDGLLFFAEREDNYDIFTIDLDSRVETQLTVHGDTDSYPAVSPNGELVAFQSNRAGEFEIYVMTIYGGSLRQLTDNSVIDRIPAWSFDGAWVIFSSDTNQNGNHDLYVVRPDGTDLTLLFSNGQRNSHPRWSADGRYVIFTTGASDDGATWEIGRIEISYDGGIPAGGNYAALTSNSQPDWSPNFSPDGSTILYLTDGTGNSAIATMDINGDNSAVIYDGPGYEWGAHYSLNGAKVAFNSNMERDPGDDQLYIMNTDGTEIEQITTTGGYYPSFVP